MSRFLLDLVRRGSGVARASDGKAPQRLDAAADAAPGAAQEAAAPVLEMRVDPAPLPLADPPIMRKAAPAAEMPAIAAPAPLASLPLRVSAPEPATRADVRAPRASRVERSSVVRAEAPEPRSAPEPPVRAAPKRTTSETSRGTREVVVAPMRAEPPARVHAEAAIRSPVDTPAAVGRAESPAVETPVRPSAPMPEDVHAGGARLEIVRVEATARPRPASVPAEDGEQRARATSEVTASAPERIAAVSASPFEGAPPRAPAAPPPIEVRIGTIEIAAERASDANAAPRAPEPVRGFDAYRMMRSYVRRAW